MATATAATPAATPPPPSATSATASTSAAAVPLSLSRPRRGAAAMALPNSKPTKSLQQQQGEEPEHCAACPPDAGPRKRRAKEVWLECDKCQSWYHWTCVAPSKTDSPDLIDKWYCKPCITTSLATAAPLGTTFKPPPRKSARASQRIDYSNLDSHLPADPERWMRALEGKTTVSGAFKTMKAEELTDEWIWGEESFHEPFLVEEPSGLGMTMPPSDMGIQQIAKAVGPKTPIEVIDVASQSSLAHWTLQQWADYYTDPNRDKVRNVISLEVSESPLSSKVIAPAIVRKLDWVDTIWPENMKGVGEYPRVQKYCLMSVARCWTDWHVDFAGSSVFYHILRGEKVFYFIRPTPDNLAAYERWSGNAELQETTWLGDMVDQVYKVELTAGNTMIIPTGWPHAVYTPCDTLVFGGNFLHSLNISTQLRVYAIELATKVPRKFRFPHFVKLLWFVANHYSTRLASLVPLSPDAPPLSLPRDMGPRVLEGLKELSKFLIEQTTRMPKDAPVSAERRRIARENVPWEVVRDPATLARRMRMLVLQAKGEPSDEACFPPPIVKEEVGAAGVGIKRKADSPAQEGKTIRFKNWDGARVANGNGQHSALVKPSANEGQILSRAVVPVTVTDRREARSDPLRVELGALVADVRTSETTTTVVRRIEEEGGGVVLETRSVITQVERVRWPEPGEQAPSSTKIRLVLPNASAGKGQVGGGKASGGRKTMEQPQWAPRPLQFATFPVYPPYGYAPQYPPPSGYGYPPPPPQGYYPYPPPSSSPPTNGHRPPPQHQHPHQQPSAPAYPPPPPPHAYASYPGFPPYAPPQTSEHRPRSSASESSSAQQQQQQPYPMHPPSANGHGHSAQGSYLMHQTQAHAPTRAGPE